jgi:hypothetical protein
MAIDYKFIRQFDANGGGVIGFEADGRVAAVGLSKADVFDPVAQAISAIADPSKIIVKLKAAVAGDKRFIGDGEACNDQGFEIQRDGIVAFFDLGDDEFKVEMSFDAFAPILRDWEAAWEAAKTYKANAN